jgi:hypothetical protein
LQFRARACFVGESALSSILPERNPMKTSLALSALVALALALPIGLDAQVVLGAGAGFRSASIALDPDDDDLDGSRTGTAFFGFVGIPVSESFRLQPGISLVQKGAKDSEDDVTLELDYLEVPILGVFSLPSEGPVGVHFFAGPTIAFERKCSVTGEDEGISLDVDCEASGVETKSTDIGVALGAALSYATSETMNLFLAAGYGLGLSNVADGEDDDQTAKNRVFGIDVGLSFLVGG